MKAKTKEHIKDAFGGLLVLAIWIALLALENMAHAQTEAILVEDGGRITVVCGQSIDPVMDDFVVDPPPIYPPDPSDCPIPDPEVVAEGKLIGGERQLMVSDRTTVLKFFVVPGDFSSISISFDPSYGGPRALSTSVSQCRGDFNIDTLPKECFTGSNRGRLILSQEEGPGLCTLEPWKEYFVNIAAINVVTGNASCPDGLFCEVNMKIVIEE